MPTAQLFIEPGMPVRQRQQLFYLPDLNDMEVVAMLHESIVDQVNPGHACHGSGRRSDQPPDRRPCHQGRADGHLELAHRTFIISRGSSSWKTSRAGSGRG